MNFLETLILYKKFLKHTKIFMDDERIGQKVNLMKNYLGIRE